MTPLRLLLAVPVVLAATLLVALAWPEADAPPSTPAAIPVATPVAATVDPAVEALRSWDARRAAAWAAADPGALRRLYVAGSRTGRADVALLRAYAGRRVSVSGLRVQLLAVDVVARSTDRLVLVVTDRLARVVARRDGRVLELPDDRPTTHRVTLVRPGGTWLVAEVEPQPAR